MRIINAIFSPVVSVLLTLALYGIETVKPEKVGLDSAKLKLVDEKMDQLISDSRMAGGIVIIARKGKVAHFGTYGCGIVKEIYPCEGYHFPHLFDDKSNYFRCCLCFTRRVN